MGPCFACGTTRSMQGLCDPCCARVLEGLEAAAKYRRGVVERLPGVVKSIVPAVSTAQVVQRSLGALRFVRHASLAGLAVLIVPLARMLPTFPTIARRLNLPDQLTVSVSALVMGLGVVIGRRLSRYYWQSIVHAWMTMPERMRQPFLTRMRTIIRRGFSDPVHWLMSFSPVVISLFCLLLLLLPRNSPLLKLGLPVGLLAFHWFFWMLAGFCGGTFRDLSWVEVCVRRQPKT